MKVFVGVLFLLLFLLCSVVLAETEQNVLKTDVILLSLPGVEGQVGIPFDQDEVEMVALYKGNTIYLRPFIRKFRLLFGKEKAVRTKTLSLPEVVEREAMRGTERKVAVFVSKQPFRGDFRFLLRNKKTGGVDFLTGELIEKVGNQEKLGVILFNKNGEAHVYQITLGSSISFHTLTKEQLKSAKKSVERTLKAAGQKNAAKKVGKL